ncbi:MAG: ABC transporter permease [Promethearchaeota archaeon]
MKKLKTFDNIIKIEGDTKKERLIRYLKFFSFPGFRIKEINKAEYELGKIKSKRTIFRRFLTPLTILGIVCFLFILWCSVFPNWATPYTFNDIAVWVNVHEKSFSPPSPEHPLGISQSGWDTLARCIWGSRYSLQVAFLAVTVASSLGIMIGIISAFAGGWVDMLLQRLIDAFSLFPGLILAFLFVAIWGNELMNIMLALGLAGIPAYARIARASTFQEKGRLYVDSAKTSGASNFKIMFKHILPNALSPLLIRITFHLAIATLSVGGLAFLGFAVGDIPTWGWDINLARQHMYLNPSSMFFPGIWIFISALGFQLMGDGLRDALDPKLKLI